MGSISEIIGTVYISKEDHPVLITWLFIHGICYGYAVFPIAAFLLPFPLCLPY
jgi:hypothetical protein